MARTVPSVWLGGQAWREKAGRGVEEFTTKTQRHQEGGKECGGDTARYTRQTARAGVG